MTTMFPAEYCQGGGTQGQPTVSPKNLEKYNRSTVNVTRYLRNYLLTGQQTRALVCYSVRLRRNDREKARDLCRGAEILQLFR